MNDSSVHSDWADEAPQDVTLSELDALVAKYLEKRKDYEAAKKLSGEKYADYQRLEEQVLATLRSANKKTYKVEGVGRATRVEKQVVTAPKTIEQKEALFNWVKEKYGDQFLMDMLSINHNRLNGFYNEEAEKEKANPLFQIPGIDAPTHVESLSFARDNG